ncbi:MAG: hypothetical protein LBE89_06240 [Helicobacteraceae bacterium]|jgi:hypothetical protein|nr:hypothetical protein [Helicobacteraceae bacterium]
MRDYRLPLLMILCLLVGCAKPLVNESRAVAATIKTPKIAVSQSGFLDTLDNDRYRLQIYAAGQATLELTVGEKICDGSLCLSPDGFNERYLSRSYPPNLLRDILGQRVIAGLRNAQIEAKENGFIQRANISGEYDIVYEKDGGSQRFRDTLNRVLIVIRHTD